MERYFCVDCEGVFIPERTPLRRDYNGAYCPFCGSRHLRIWEIGKAIPDYYGKIPFCDSAAMCAHVVCKRSHCRFALDNRSAKEGG
jgi:DNA-directed RNA polymerase subunit RPC12/RpoP